MSDDVLTDDQLVVVRQKKKRSEISPNPNKSPLRVSFFCVVLGSFVHRSVCTFWDVASK
jgi:hypothetical protein